MNQFKFKIIGAALVLFLFTACVDDLNTEPKVELTLDKLLEQDPNAVDGLVSKIYGTFALSGPDGPSSTDVTTKDAGEAAFLRSIINLQDFSADGMKNRWGDDGLDQLTTTSGWNANNKFFRYLYDRAYYTISQSSNLIQILKTTKVDVPNRENHIAELRFLRGLAYYYLIDCFGKGAITTEADINTTTPKKESTRKELFAFLESELKEVEGTITATKSYGKADKNVVRMLLAKLYLNAEVYTGTQRYDDALLYSKKVIDEGGYTLAPNFGSVFSGDNNTSPEIIYFLIADAVVSQGYGNTTYIINGNLSTETMNPNNYGAIDAWTGHRATKAWYGLFNNGNLVDSPDDRAKLFFTTGHSYEMNDYKKWTDGYPSVKFTNKNFVGPTNATSFANTDFPLFRLSDAYLMYAECVLRGASGGSAGLALEYVNKVRTRSHAGEINAGELNLDFILKERGRELNLEGHRRQDLIRFGKFTGGSYLWPWKGGVKDGVAIPETYNLYPIPTTALQANPQLTQNPGYSS
ncbi:RagB/SusD family nutrient uptake outer membrane protein [Flavobacterium sp. CSZ]|uniref:RagB/SusD family nutrient uptake outer membrane protein n=1 Tax=Flavobacterium sp. CSZ TaxID=2783791 RepID=UPI00188BF800|nr:RagB/SusD family nutrient uptake outer membrane protein [Flavobacterium sp. CSZ]MBF4487996.1 RagB/SusD family nutrient uptake outer membrane protein [Flavobacterium sp. CSZ]